MYRCLGHAKRPTEHGNMYDVLALAYHGGLHVMYATVRSPRDMVGF